MRDEFEWRRLSKREKYKRAADALAEEPGKPSRAAYEDALNRQRSRPGMPNAGKWMGALQRQKEPLSPTPVPKRITMALNLADLYGPEVDRACGVEEPTVDMWETGLVVPTREQIHRLAFITDVKPAFFYLPPPPPLEGGVICGSGGCQPLVPADADKDLETLW